MSDGIVQVQPDAAGKKVDTSEITRADATVVARQRAVLGDGDNPESGGLAQVRDHKLQVADANSEKLDRVVDLLEQILFILKSQLS